MRAALTGALTRSNCVQVGRGDAPSPSVPFTCSPALHLWAVIGERDVCDCPSFACARLPRLRALSSRILQLSHCASRPTRAPSAPFNPHWTIFSSVVVSHVPDHAAGAWRTFPAHSALRPAPLLLLCCSWQSTCGFMLSCATLISSEVACSTMTGKETPRTSIYTFLTWPSGFS